LRKNGGGRTRTSRKSSEERLRLTREKKNQGGVTGRKDLAKVVKRRGLHLSNMWQSHCEGGSVNEGSKRRNWGGGSTMYIPQTLHEVKRPPRKPKRREREHGRQALQFGESRLTGGSDRNPPRCRIDKWPGNRSKNGEGNG